MRSRAAAHLTQKPGRSDPEQVRLKEPDEVRPDLDRSIVSRHVCLSTFQGELDHFVDVVRHHTVEDLVTLRPGRSGG